MKSFMRRVLLVLLDPRPRWYAAGWLWGLVAVVALAFWMTARPHQTFSMQSAATVYRTPGGSFQLEDTFPPRTGQKLVLGLSFRIVEGTDYLRFEAPLPTLISATPTLPALTPPELRDIAVVIGEHWAGDYGERQAERGFNLLAKGQTVALKRGWRSRIYECLAWVGYAVLAMAILVSYVRATQTAWYRRQLARLEKGLCPSCGYDLSGSQLNRCPECGISPQAARHEAIKALRLG